MTMNTKVQALVSSCVERNDEFKKIIAGMSDFDTLPPVFKRFNKVAQAKQSRSAPKNVVEKCEQVQIMYKIALLRLFSFVRMQLGSYKRSIQYISSMQKFTTNDNVVCGALEQRSNVNLVPAARNNVLEQIIQYSQCKKLTNATCEVYYAALNVVNRFKCNDEYYVSKQVMLEIVNNTKNEIVAWKNNKVNDVTYNSHGYLIAEYVKPTNTVNNNTSTQFIVQKMKGKITICSVIKYVIVTATKKIYKIISRIMQ
ncbi:hypothetical protein BDAP_000073 [Binucleata daphniae]